MSTGTVAEGAPAAYRTPAYSWVVLAMLAFIYIFNFLDRQLTAHVVASSTECSGPKRATAHVIASSTECSGGAAARHPIIRFSIQIATCETQQSRRARAA
jgi:hypothetical protein